MIDLDHDSLDRLLPAAAGAADWDDVLSRSGGGKPRRSRLVVVLAAAALVVALGTASAFAVRDLIVGTPSWRAESLTWSPDGRRISYNVPGPPDDLYVMNADGSAKRMLRRNAGGAAWSPDGRKLAFLGSRGDPRRVVAPADIYVANADGGGLRKLPHTAGSWPLWLPDGRLAIVKSRAVWVMNADGSRRRLVTLPENDSLGWSPDGRSIAFVGYPRPHLPRIYVMAADGSGRRWLADGTRPLWSPRGEVIAFSPYRKGGLRSINADGSGERTLTTHLYAVNGSQGYAWSPDGRKIVFTFGRFPRDFGHTEIYVMNADGSGQRNLTRHAGADDFAAWSPDGRKIVFASDRSGGGIFVMNADGSGLRKLAP